MLNVNLKLIFIIFQVNDAASLFTLMVLLSDEYLNFKKDN